ncbi:semaphorin-7A [Scomber japonicus]|uniref:semaphorin-7A n=1 Tax=Scomber japonicus TaxID=13676 RepID=UPI002306846F|nr:semaphorin-7A [Scomber japonicus]
MILLFLPACLLLSNLYGLTKANLTHKPRMIFTEEESTMTKLPLFGSDTPVRILVGGDTVTAVGRTHLKSFNFQDPNKTPLEKKVLWPGCTQRVQNCNYNIAVVEETGNTNEVFVCGTNERQTLCCNMMLSQESAQCISSDKLRNIEESIRDFTIKEGESSVLVLPTSGEDEALFHTLSGSQVSVGIHKFGRNKVGPATHDKEQYYVGLVRSEREDVSQNRIYAFYKEKNKDTSLDSEMWLPYVTQVCMNDKGGPKNNLQFSWTSQMNARLYCGDSGNRQYFSELIDVATIHADLWQDTRIYALFRNEWGMSAVCVYTIEAIDNVFRQSPFKGSDRQSSRSRKCLPDSTKISVDVLNMIKKTSEMEQWVQPVGNSGPLLINRHSYTHILADSLQHKRNNHTVLFLSLRNGGVHKVTQNESQAFVIAGFQPFHHSAHILSITLNQPSRKLYVSSTSELVQLDVADCTHYGHTCQECILARDPYCGWDGGHCVLATESTLQDVDNGSCDKCPSASPSHYQPFKGSGSSEDSTMDRIKVPSESKYFLQCQVTSHHAQYIWLHDGKPVSCSMTDQQCLLLIDSMGPEKVGSYKCESEEMGHKIVLAQYRVEMGSGSGIRSSGPLVLVCLVVTLIKTVSCWS